MACADRRLLVLDDTMLRDVGANNIVNTVADVELYGYTGIPNMDQVPQLNGPQCLGILPQGDLAVGRSIAAATSSQQHSQALVELHKVLTAQSASPAGDLDSTVTVRVDGGGGGRRVFLAHRSVLAARSEYFRRLLDPAGGFADSGEAEVALEDADPEAFSWLLAYMYTGELHMPDELLRPAAELAGRLLMPADCSTKLVRLLATVTPGSVVSELIWAAQHDMAELVARLKAYLVRHRKVVACDKLGELVARFPDMAASLTRELTAAP
ncbi:Ankyrin repeat and BTB/POZ domain-containing protein 1 [Pleodorina starrii]|uniref:Ankyrin repeat and BTB/POZ domain-containing protein 1 n=1 Tax=Pleodorina starrii TaxID=330485 RepID=A0A9W6BZV2_9CHLO|nr:Ankyrin repeat and BTB/POZ domain-containing protein 1 [Pleodorina starrii]